MHCICNLYIYIYIDIYINRYVSCWFCFLGDPSLAHGVSRKNPIFCPCHLLQAAHVSWITAPSISKPAMACQVSRVLCHSASDPLASLSRTHVDNPG